MPLAFGCNPDHWDPRDIHVCALELPKSKCHELVLPYDRPVRDQVGGSCVGNSICHAIELYADLHGVTCPRLSAQYLYTLSRWSVSPSGYDGVVDSGTSIRTAYKTLSRWGICVEGLWESDPTTLNKEPSAMAKLDAADRYGELGELSYHRATWMSDIDSALDAGMPCVLGLPVDEAWYTHDGVRPLREPTGGTVGNHAVVGCGRTGDGDLVILNSWGERWGVGGRGVVARDYVSKRAFDIWTGRLRWT